MRGRCFIGTYMRHNDHIGSYRLLWTGKHYGKNIGDTRIENRKTKHRDSFTCLSGSAGLQLSRWTPF
jgi:hypothetical protein